MTYAELEVALAAARKYVNNKPENESSARFCLAEAVDWKNRIDRSEESARFLEAAMESAGLWVKKSLSYSLGIGHPEFIKLFNATR